MWCHGVQALLIVWHALCFLNFEVLSKILYSSIYNYHITVIPAGWFNDGRVCYYIAQLLHRILLLCGDYKWTSIISQDKVKIQWSDSHELLGYKVTTVFTSGYLKMTIIRSCSAFSVISYKLRQSSRFITVLIPHQQTSKESVRRCYCIVYGKHMYKCTCRNRAIYIILQKLQ